MEASSTINTPHPDDLGDETKPDALDPDAFFDQTVPGDEPEAAPEPVEEKLAPEPKAAEKLKAEPEPEEEAKTPLRGYVVIREVDLTPEVCKALLDESKDGNAPEYRKGYFVLEECESRSAKNALGTAFAAHRETLGDSARLVAITEKSWAVRNVRPRTRVMDSLDID